jgi:RNA polymerase sigma-70 factor (ECF subfamily)
MPAETPSDAELVRAAQAGDAAQLGLLLTRHLAALRAVALSLLGYGPDAEDAVQDAVVVAMQRFDQVRDPDAVGPWLQAIVRNGCRMRLRSAAVSRTGPLTDQLGRALVDRAPTPEELLERHCLQDWVGHALAELSEPVRLVALLRYFTEASSYQQIAALCGVPVGTVRSRLSEARAGLSRSLLDTAELAHPDASAFGRARRRQADEAMALAQRGHFLDVVKDGWWPDAELIAPNGQRGGDREFAVRAMDLDLNDGVRQRLVNVAASRDLVIWEAELISPPERPQHCPPAVIWLHRLRQGRVQQVRLFHPRERPAPAGPSRA